MNEQQKLEYSTLRTELIALSGRQISILALTMTATGVIVGIGLDSNSNQSIVVLSPLMLLCFAGLQIISQAFATIRISSYISLFLEKETTHMRWETAMYHYRDSNGIKAKRNLSAGLGWRSFQIIIPGVGFFCLALSFILIDKSKDLWPQVWPPLVITLLWSAFSLFYVSRLERVASGEVDKWHRDHWAKVKESLWKNDEDKNDEDKNE